MGGLDPWVATSCFLGFLQTNKKLKKYQLQSTQAHPHTFFLPLISKEFNKAYSFKNKKHNWCLNILNWEVGEKEIFEIFHDHGKKSILSYYL